MSKGRTHGGAASDVSCDSGGLLWEHHGGTSAHMERSVKTDVQPLQPACTFRAETKHRWLSFPYLDRLASTVPGFFTSPCTLEYLQTHEIFVGWDPSLSAQRLFELHIHFLQIEQRSFSAVFIFPLGFNCDLSYDGSYRSC